ncbi:cytochrome b-c1 complex subunit 2, mitochondrial [Colletotrichum spaethianum]|uniref:Cytochrome b-c1 complex subunit 2, mitochondrial n=1 Tax=Colletotrichum spaethianum TaxID=700344 RepID=A0AA37PGJ4_9PEZI|nr:cytochrome b-c1 complex subunit 2, mitochondrial [Colletotrichum spaethianum]GKT51908.1 cytochrome b-c1 complex subunit 2, mitochondrial [Colletotrichum spaethianum]
MISRPSLARPAQQALRHSSCARTISGRRFASAAAGSGAFETSDVGGVKVAARDSQGPTTKLAIVAKAGTRYQPLPGLAAGLESFAFKVRCEAEIQPLESAVTKQCADTNTAKRSGLRIVRESELLGSQLTAYHTREALVLEASFFRDDLPYFTELLAEVVSQTKYTTHEFHEEVQPVLRLKQSATSAAALALDSAHSVAFHSGLGSPANLTPSIPIQPYLSEYAVSEFAQSAYAKSNIALVADGASAANVSKWAEQFFKAVPSASSGKLALNTAATKYYGGEQRTYSPSGNSLVIAFPGATNGQASPELAVLAALLGGKSSIKWSPGFSLINKAVGSAPGLSTSTVNLNYSDASLLAVQLSGSASAVRTAAQEAVKALKSISEGTVSKEDLTKAIAKAKFDALEATEKRSGSILLAGSGLVHNGKAIDAAEIANSIGSVTAEKLKAATKTLLEGKASVAAVGDLYALPYAEELGLRV